MQILQTRYHAKIADKTAGASLAGPPDPAKSRRIAEVRLVFCGFIAVAIIGAIGARIVDQQRPTAIYVLRLTVKPRQPCAAAF